MEDAASPERVNQQVLNVAREWEQDFARADGDTLERDIEAANDRLREVFFAEGYFGAQQCIISGDAVWNISEFDDEAEFDAEAVQSGALKFKLGWLEELSIQDPLNEGELSPWYIVNVPNAELEAGADGYQQVYVRAETAEITPLELLENLEPPKEVQDVHVYDEYLARKAKEFAKLQRSGAYLGLTAVERVRKDIEFLDDVNNYLAGTELLAYILADKVYAPDVQKNPLKPRRIDTADTAIGAACLAAIAVPRPLLYPVATKEKELCLAVEVITNGTDNPQSLARDTILHVPLESQIVSIKPHRQ